MELTSIVIPAKNEAENIGPTVQAIRKAFRRKRWPYEIVVVNDGSTDGTGKVVKKIADEDDGVRVIRNRDPYGFGNAIKKGLDKCKGEIVIIAMADASDDPQDMIHYVQKIREGYDCCFGTRWCPEATVEGYPRLKWLLNRCLNLVIQVLFCLPYNDVTNAFKCYRRKTIQGIRPLLSRHFNMTVELPLKAIVRGYSFAVIPTNWQERQSGKTHLKFKEMGSRYLFIILYVWFEKMLCGQDYIKEKETVVTRVVKPLPKKA